MRCILSHIEAKRSFAQPYVLRLSPNGEAVEAAIAGVGQQYPNIAVEKYVIMPNHVHLLLRVGLNCDNGKEGPPVQTVIGHLKRSVSLRLGRSIWQKGFYDHLIRDQQDYVHHWNYIEANPVKWVEDEYFFADEP